MGTGGWSLSHPEPSALACPLTRLQASFQPAPQHQASEGEFFPTPRAESARRLLPGVRTTASRDWTTEFRLWGFKSQHEGFLEEK